MSDRERPSDRQNLHLVTDHQKDAAIILMNELIRRANAGRITVLAVTEHESGPGLKKHLEITYADKAGVTQ